MTKKNYIAIAQAINDVLWREKADPATVTTLIGSLATVFANDNPRFDAERFFAACLKNPKE